MLVLNRAQGLDLPTVNDLYRRLRDLEVNSFKRFVGLTAMEPGPFCIGLDPKELLLAATCANMSGSLPRFSRALLWHSQELAHLVADYRKPLVCHVGGTARDAGGAFASLAHIGGVYEDSEISVEACFSGLVPTGGMTYVLGGLKWGLGEFIALTGWPVRGPDLVYLEIAKNWLSPDALPFLELTAEKQLEVTETDARTLLQEHFLRLPEGLRNGESLLEGDSLQRSFIPLIDEAFSKKDNPFQIQQAIERILAGKNADGKDSRQKPITGAQREFLQECLSRMTRASPLAAHTTLRLIREAQRFRRGNKDGNRWKSDLDEHGERGALVEMLRLETNAQQKLLCSKDALLGLHARCMGREVESGAWSSRDLSDVLSDEVAEVLKLPQPGKEPAFVVHPRSDFTLSQHPKLRRYHPDWNPDTGLDHDPAWMEAEARRWSPDLFKEERRQAIEGLLGDSDPSAFGLSRWARVEPSLRSGGP